MTLNKSIIKALLCFILITSCGSEHLSNSKAEDIISDCLDDAPEQKRVFLTLGKKTFSENKHDTELLKKYNKLQDENMLNIEFIREVNKYRKGKEYNISLTKKANKYVEKMPQNGSSATVKSFKYTIDEVLEVQEIPAISGAKVKVQFKATDITPFAILSIKDPAEFWIKDIRMTKTSNGWKYCDNY